MINLYNEDCLEAMKRMDDNSYELAFVDPPYGISRSTKVRKVNGWKKHAYKEWDNSIPSKEYFDQLFRVSKNQIIFGGNYFVDYLYPNRCWLYWNKGQPNQLLMGDGELAWTSFDSVLREIIINRSQIKKNGGSIHPTQKPVALYTWILNNYAKENDRILDTHLGSGSIAIACHNLGFDLDGYELDVDYYEAASKRLKEHQRQLKLF